MLCLTKTKNLNSAFNLFCRSSSFPWPFISLTDMDLAWRNQLNDDSLKHYSQYFRNIKDIQVCIIHHLPLYIIQYTSEFFLHTICQNIILIINKMQQNSPQIYSRINTWHVLIGSSPCLRRTAMVSGNIEYNSLLLSVRALSSALRFLRILLLFSTCYKHKHKYLQAHMISHEGTHTHTHTP